MSNQFKSYDPGKPIILITTSNVVSAGLSEITGDTEIAYSDQATAIAIIKAGGVPLYIPTMSLEQDNLRMYIELADGIVLPGADTHVNPLLYDKTVLGFEGTRIDDQRDQVDIRLIKYALERGLPLLGICKGMQIINVALGGTLHQEIPHRGTMFVNHNIQGKRTQGTHKANLIDGSLLARIFMHSEMDLNGGHQQAVNQLSDELRPSAIAEDGIVEAYEGKDHPFLLGVQFHAELLGLSDAHRLIFERFIEAANLYKRSPFMRRDRTATIGI